MKNKPRVIHRAAYNKNVIGEIELTVCGKTSQKILKTNDDNKVTCLICKMNKKETII